MRRVVVLIVCALLVAPDASSRDRSYLRVVRDFYNDPVALQSYGLPEPPRLRALGKYLTPGFIDALQKANEVENDCIKKTPAGLKPPIWENAIFAGAVESTERARIGSPRYSGKQPHVPVRLYVIDKDSLGRPEDTEGHIVIARLSHVAGSWLISDVIYDDGTNLRSALVEYAAQKCDG